jgi:predicted RNA-binding Zn-ribbon protein involved in translation (DUF1610 family)
MMEFTVNCDPSFEGFDYRCTACGTRFSVQSDTAFYYVDHCPFCGNRRIERGERPEPAGKPAEGGAA